MGDVAGADLETTGTSSQVEEVTPSEPGSWPSSRANPPKKKKSLVDQMLRQETS